MTAVQPAAIIRRMKPLTDIVDLPLFKTILSHLSRLLSLLIFLLLAACNLSQPQQVTYVTATVPPVTTTPIITATPTIELTPTIPPQVELQTANQYLMNGYFENAISAYQDVLTNGASPDIGASASLGMGRAALREGLFSDAISALNGFISQFASDPRAIQAHFLRGDAYMGLSRWSDALADFQYYLAKRPGLIDSYVQERIGDAQLALGSVQDALTSYNAAIQAGRSLVPLLALREKVARVYSIAKQPQQAVAQYDAILDVAKNDSYLAEIEFDAAQTLLDNDDQKDGLDQMESVFTDYPTTPYAYQAMRALVAGGRDVDDYARGQASFVYGDYHDAIDSLTRYTTETPLVSIPANLFMLLGQSYSQLGNPDAAFTALQTIVNQYPSDPLFGQALLEQGRVKFLANDIDGAIRQYMNVGTQYNYLPEAPEALWRAGYLDGTNNKPADSINIFKQLADAFPNTDQAKSGLFLAAAEAYSMKDPTGAEALYARLAVTTSGDDEAAAYLWVGRLAMARGDQKTANDALQLAVSASPGSYFSDRATDILRGRDSFARPASVNFQFDDAAQMADAENWMRQKFNLTQQGDLAPLSSTLQTDARLIRGNELWTVGAYDEAKVEFNDVVSAYQSDPLTSFQLAIFLRNVGDYAASIQSAANVIDAAKVDTLSAPPFLARLRYPAYYADLIQSVGKDVDPLLLLSLIRYESLFDTTATASAGERGLTQIVPATAQSIANALKMSDYQPGDLFRPYVSIEFGAHFLKQNLDQFGGSPQAALAAYNAGPGRAQDWLKLSGGDPDQFITAITLASTQTYVENIYSFYDVYRALYGVQPAQ